MSETEPQSGAEILARIKPRLREQSTYICLRPDLLDQWEKLDAELTELREKDRSQPGRLTDKASPDAVALAERIMAVEAEIEATQLRVTFRALPKAEWQALCEQHPPRKGNDPDQFLGYDRNAVHDALVRKCLIDPVFDDESWRDFEAVLNPSEWNELRETATAVNGGVIEAPKSLQAALVLSSREPASERPATGA